MTDKYNKKKGGGCMASTSLLIVAVGL